VKGLDQAANLRQGLQNVFRRFFALGLVVGELAMAGGGRRGVERDGEVRRLLVGENVEERLGEAKSADVFQPFEVRMGRRTNAKWAR